MLDTNGDIETVRPRVLVIDDAIDVHRLLGARLKSEQIELVAAHSADEGMKLASRLRPDLILLDLEMPEVDGFECLRRLKDSAETVAIPVVVLSGLQSPQDKVMAFDLGAVDYVTKPFELTELRVRVRSALKMAALLRMLAQKAQIDGLTGLWNRVFFDERLRAEQSGATRHGRPLSLAIIDLDHFKSINDTFGHPAGDEVLQGLSELLQGTVRQSDLACRYGGEEFALIMPDTAPVDAQGLCDRLRVKLGEMTWRKHPERRVTCSIGVAGMSATTSALPAEGWLAAADRNLYTAKKGGRNRVVASDLAAPEVSLRQAS